MARFVMSHRIAGCRSHAERDETRARLDEAVDQLHSCDVRHKVESCSGRCCLFVDCDEDELSTKAETLHADVMCEPEIERHPAVCMPPAIERRIAASGGTSAPTGTGATFSVTVQGGGAPVPGAKATLFLAATTRSNDVDAWTDAAGRATFTYDPAAWRPSSVLVRPPRNFWGMVVDDVPNGGTIDLRPLPRTGPLAWWHALLGMATWSENRGAGMRIGVVDTGVGPHPYLAHVTSIGAFIGGQHDSAAASGADAQMHGTHVTGIIAARPAADSGHYGGVCAGADVFVARVFQPGRAASQIDIAEAIETLAMDHGVDLINLSLVSSRSSQIERDSIQFAIERGALCICAAGNGAGAPVGCPAAYPEAVAVTAAGVAGVTPADTVAGMNQPQEADKFAYGGQLYLASFSNIGPEVNCTDPGVGILSTVPADASDPTPYGSMSGTSMAAPAACAALASILAEDTHYRRLPRDEARAAYAHSTLLSRAIPLGLAPRYQGAGLGRSAW